MVFDVGLLGRLQVPRASSSRSWTTRSTRSGSARRSRWCRSCCRSGSRSSRSRRSRTWSTSTAARPRPRRSCDVAILQAFFPHLVAGPIVRANELLPQLRTPRDPRAVLAGPALFLIVGGVVKKTVIADELARRVVDPVYSDPLAHSGARDARSRSTASRRRSTATSPATPTWRSGSRCCSASSCRRTSTGPTSPLSLQDFWRRWHMTLSRWLRDYLYIPLGGNRGGPAADLPQPDGHDAARRALARRRRGRSCSGAAIHGARCRPSAGRASASRGLRGFPPWVAWLVTFNVVCLAWVFFRAPDLATAFDVLGGLGAVGGPSPLVTLPLVLLVVAAVAVQARAAGLVAQAEAWLVARPVARAGRGRRRAARGRPTRPSGSRAWPRSSTTSSDHGARARQRPHDAGRAGCWA